MDRLNLNIGAAQADLAAMNATRCGIESAVDDLRGVAAALYGGTMLGSGADTGTDLYIMLSRALTSANEVVAGYNRAVSQAAGDTEGYDRGGACSAIGGY